jgi:hypothetical protein
MVSNMQTAPTVGAFFEGGNVFRTTFSMTSLHQNLVNSPLRQHTHYAQLAQFFRHFAALLSFLVEGRKDPFFFAFFIYF